MRDDLPELARVLRLVDRVRRQRYAARLIAGTCLFLSLALGTILVLVGVETFLGPPRTLRWAMLLFFTLLVVVAAILFVGRRLLENPSDEEIALLIEAVHPELHNELINAVRFSLEPPERRHSFVRAAIRESDSAAARIETRGIVNWRQTRNSSIVFGIVVAASAAVLLIAPARVANALTRLSMPSANVQKVGSVRIVTVVPGDATVIAGDNLTIEAVLDRSDENTAVLLEHFSDKDSTHREPMLRAETNRFTCDLIEIKTPRNYRVVAGNARSRDYTISVTERPLVTRISARYIYPSYTGRAEESVEDTAGTIQALKGSMAAITIFANKQLHSARLLIEGLDPLEFGVAPDGASAATRSLLSITQDAAGAIEIVDTFGCKNSRSVRIVAQKDRTPQVKIVAPGEDSVIAVGEALQLAISGTDDYGIVRAELLEKRLSLAVGGAAEPQVVKSWRRFLDTRNVGLHWKWNFEKSSYKNGEIIRYFVRMVDGNKVDGPGVGTSAEFTVRLEDAAARAKERARKFTNWQAELEKVLQQQKELRRKTGALQSPGTGDLSDKKK